MSAVIPPAGSSPAHPLAGKTKPIVYFVGLTAALAGLLNPILSGVNMVKETSVPRERA